MAGVLITNHEPQRFFSFWPYGKLQLKFVILRLVLSSQTEHPLLVWLESFIGECSAKLAYSNSSTIGATRTHDAERILHTGISQRVNLHCFLSRWPPYPPSGWDNKPPPRTERLILWRSINCFTCRPQWTKVGGQNPVDYFDAYLNDVSET